MKRKKVYLIALIVAGTLLFPACSNSPETGEATTAGENVSEASFNLFKRMSEIRADANPQSAFQSFKSECFKSDNPLTLRFMIDYINDKQDKPQVDLKVVELKPDGQLTVAGDPSLGTAGNTIMMSSINCSPEELRKMPRAMKSGLNFINKQDFTAIYPVTPEFIKSAEMLNKKIGYKVIEASGMIENEIAYILSGKYQYWDATNSYSTEEKFEKSKYSDNVELAKIEWYLNELENGSLKELYKSYAAGTLALVDYETARQKDAVNPQTILTVNGPVTTADFQYPLEDTRNQQYAKLILGLDQTCKITDIKAQNRNFISLVQSSNVTGDGITVIKKKLEFYAKNKPVNNPNEENNDDWDKNLNQE